MAINVRQKGACGEREIADDLNFIVYSLMKELEYPKPTMLSIQRNQNQSAVGGADLTNTFGIAIEVKRQEALSVNTWWAQCVASAQRNNEVPVLLYRQNGKKWRCVLMVDIVLPGVNGSMYGEFSARSEIGYDEFKAWFRMWARRTMLNGHEVKI